MLEEKDNFNFDNGFKNNFYRNKPLEIDTKPSTDCVLKKVEKKLRFYFSVSIWVMRKARERFFEKIGRKDKIS